MAIKGKFTDGAARYSRTRGIKTDISGNIVSLQRIYIFTTDGPPPTPPSAKTVTNLPAEGSVHPQLNWLFAQETLIEPVLDIAENDTFQAIVNYERGAVDGSSPSGIQKYTSISYGLVEETLDLLNDANTGEAIVNSAGELFANTIQTVRVGPAVSFSRLESTPPESVFDLNCTINNVAVTVLGFILPKRCGLVKISIDDTLASFGYHYEYKYEIIGRFNPVINGINPVEEWGHDDAILDCGFNYKGNDYATTNKLKRFMVEVEQDDGTFKLEKSPIPQLLDPDGKDNRGNAPYFVRASKYKEMPWVALRLPSARPTMVQ